jgi:transcriptional antiterminator
MRVRISYTVEVPDSFRREINRFYGREGLATREQVKDWFEAYGVSMDDDLAAQAETNEEKLDAEME